MFILVTAIGSVKIYADPSGNIYYAQSALNMELLKVEVKENGSPVSFLMGSDTTETGRLTDENKHKVFLTKNFYLGKYEVTQAEYARVMQDNPYGYDHRPSNFSKTETRPVESVSWYEAELFVELLNQKEKKAGRLSQHWSYSLPTEAEWEFACRAGTSSVYNTGSQITNQQANFLPNESNQTTVVGKFDSNAWGFHDMHGNVKEWCSDWYQAYFEGTYVDPGGKIYVMGPSGNYLNPEDFFQFQSNVNNNSQTYVIPSKVCRGGAFDSHEDGLRSARRYKVPSTNRLINLGFRLALRQEEPSTSLDKSLTCNVVSFLSGSSYRFETCWEDKSVNKTLESTSEEISELIDQPNVLFSDHLSVRTIYTQNNSNLRRPGDNGYEDVAVVAYEVNATQVDGSGQGKPVVSEIPYHKFKDFVQRANPGVVNVQPNNLTDANYSFQSSSVGFIQLREASFSERVSQFLKEGNFLGDSSGWMWTEWFGYYFADSFPWIFHENLGWVYIMQEHADNLWLYRQNLGWAWTSSADWWKDKKAEGEVNSAQSHALPYLYRFGNDENDTKTWTYFSRNLSATTLYDFNESEWFILDQPYDIKISVFPEKGGSVVGNGQYYRWQNVSLQAVANPNYQFTRWDGDEDGSFSDHQFVAVKNKSINALFFPLVSSSLSADERVNSYKEIIHGMTGLSGQQKEWALAELLVFGRSTTAGIP